MSWTFCLGSLDFHTLPQLPWGPARNQAPIRFPMIWRVLVLFWISQGSPQGPCLLSSATIALTLMAGFLWSVWPPTHAPICFCEIWRLSRYSAHLAGEPCPGKRSMTRELFRRNCSLCLWFSPCHGYFTSSLSFLCHHPWFFSFCLDLSIFVPS